MDRIFGIDLGTTNSLIAEAVDGNPRIIADPATKKTSLPSVVHLESDGAVLVGAAAKRREATESGLTVASVKRFMGLGMTSVTDDDRRMYPLPDNTDGSAEFLAGERSFTPPEISAEILKELKRRAEEVTGDNCAGVVVTVPAYFDDSQRQATRDAARLAELRVLRLVNEPTAAALAYGLDSEGAAETVAVYDLGGGTFDISILQLKEGVFRVLSTNGDTRLGGDDIDRALADKMLERASNEPRCDGLTGERTVLALARQEAENVKIRLTTADETIFRLESSSGDLVFESIVSCADFESVALETIRRTETRCRQALSDASLAVEDIDQVVLVGGSTKSPLVRSEVERIFSREPLTSLDPDQVVALGAAVQADILSGGRRDLLLLDVVPLSLGIETMGGTFTRLIHRNTTIPASFKETFSTPADNVTAIDLHVLQGERELANDNRSLARFELKGIVPQPAGVPRVEVTFLIDANGILSVTAIDQNTGNEHTVEVKPSYGLSDERIEDMLIESMDHAEDDVAQRLLIEARVEAEDVLKKTQRLLEQETDDLLSGDERSDVSFAADELEEATKGSDRKLILEASEKLDQIAQPLTERLMTRDIRKWLLKKTLTEVTAS